MNIFYEKRVFASEKRVLAFYSSLIQNKLKQLMGTMKKEDKIKELKLTGKEVVIQGNVFLDSPKNLTLQEYKLFMFLISKIDPAHSDFSTFRVTAIEFAKAIGVENSTYIYRDLQAITKRLMERVVNIHRPQDKLLVQTHLVSSVHYWYGEGYVDIKISDDMKPHLLNLKREFTQYKLSQITRLSSLYAIRIYEMLKKQEDFGKRTFFVDELRKKLNVHVNEYKRFTDFKRYVLDIAKREINSKTDLKIDFKFMKTGRKITAIEFDIKPKAVKEDNQENLYYLNNAVNPKQIREITKFGLSPKEAKSILDYTDDAIVENAIKAVKSQIKKGNAKNPKAMIRTAVKEKWHDNENEKIEKAQKPIKQRTGFMKILEHLFRK